MSRKKISTTVYLEQNQVRALKRISDATNLPGAVLIREGVDLRIELEKRGTAARSELLNAKATERLVESSERPTAAGEAVIRGELKDARAEIVRLRHRLETIHDMAAPRPVLSEALALSGHDK